MNPPRRRLVGLATLATLVVVTAGCGGREHPNGSVDPTVPPTSLGPSVTIRIGFLGAASGTGSRLGAAVHDAALLAISQFKGDGPGIDVILDVRSTGGTPAGAAIAAHRLVADGDVAVVGPQSPPEVRAALPILNRAGVPSVTATATASGLAESGWTSFFRVVADDRQQGIDEAQEMVASLHLSSLAVLGGDDAPDRVRAATVSVEAGVLGATVDVDRPVASRAAAATAAAAVVGSGVDGVFFSGRAAVGRALVLDLTRDGYQGVILMASDSPASILSELGSTADGVYVASAADDPAATAARNPGALAFYDAYRAAFGSQPPIWAAEGYDATNAILAALTGGARTGPTIGSYLQAHSSSGVSGPVAFGADGNQVDPPVYVSEIRNGQPIQVAISAAAAG